MIYASTIIPSSVLRLNNNLRLLSWNVLLWSLNIARLVWSSHFQIQVFSNSSIDAPPDRVVSQPVRYAAVTSSAEQSASTAFPAARLPTSLITVPEDIQLWVGATPHRAAEKSAWETYAVVTLSAPYFFEAAQHLTHCVDYKIKVGKYY